MTSHRMTGHSDRSGPGGRTLLLATGAVIGAGALAWVAWTAEQRAIARRPPDSAPQRARRAGRAGEGAAQSAAVTLALPPRAVFDAIGAYDVGATAGDAPGLPLARALLGDDATRFDPVQHDGADVVSWRTEDGSCLVKLVLRPARGGGMTSLTAIIAREDDRTIPRPGFGTGAKTRLRQALTRFRMWVETGELARA